MHGSDQVRPYLVASHARLAEYRRLHHLKLSEVRPANQHRVSSTLSTSNMHVETNTIETINKKAAFF